MGELLDSLSASPKGRMGRKSMWPRMVASLPADVVDDILAAFENETIEVSRIKEAVEAAHDVPDQSISTWRNWARAHRAGKL